MRKLDIAAYPPAIGYIHTTSPQKCDDSLSSLITSPLDKKTGSSLLPDTQTCAVSDH
ncbi:unnamed protein product [Periconia digitata]|uniref:Uncharacterized protein n=1 Tax=Periconia digitata TaxID=1303443 RepID=A0A9W4XQM4_9PLEO|nr:unnamed protein product [Periconia digitata]